MKTNPYEHVSSEQLDDWLTLSLATLKAQRKKLTPFDLLLRDIYQTSCEFIHTYGRRPTTVFLGSFQMDAFKYSPPYMMTPSQEAKAILGERQIEGLEVVQVLKDSFLQVA